MKVSDFYNYSVVFGIPTSSFSSFLTKIPVTLGLDTSFSQRQDHLESVTVSVCGLTPFSSR